MSTRKILIEAESNPDVEFLVSLLALGSIAALRAGSTNERAVTAAFFGPRLLELCVERHLREETIEMVHRATELYDVRQVAKVDMERTLGIIEASAHKTLLLMPEYDPQKMIRAGGPLS